MSLRAYLLIDVADDINQQQFIAVIRELEEMQGIEYVDPVAGRYDLLVMVETPLSVEAHVSKIRSKPWIKNVEILRIISILERRGVLSRSKS